jgi:mRNA-degrading endonuclease RelE of RelBE toxin-antitoxin system
MVKKYQIKILPEARKGLREQMDYVRRRSSDAQAKKVRKAILETVKTLETFPTSHEKLHEICDEQIIYRRTFKWDYRIIFRINKETITVLVVDIDNTVDDPQKLLDRFGK